MTLTAKQDARFAKAEALLPAGYSYHLHDETSGEGSYSHLTVRGAKVWGVEVRQEREDGRDEGVGLVNAPEKKGWLQAHTTCQPEAHAAVRLMLNRAAAALWHRQPDWSTAQ